MPSEIRPSGRQNLKFAETCRPVSVFLAALVTYLVISCVLIPLGVVAVYMRRRALEARRQRRGRLRTRSELGALQESA